MVPAPALGRTARVFAGPPVVCGHRGIGRGVVRGHRENTIGSFRAAAAARVPWVEIDARLTADDVLVAHHDPVLPDGRPVVETTAREAEELGLMRVADLFTALPRRVGVDVEIKTALEDALRPRGQTTAALVARLLAGEQGRRRLLASSFDPAAL